MRFHKDARGRPLLANGQVFLDHPDGADLYLTVDSGLQFKLETELQRVVEEFKAQSALGLILDAETSAVLAMANIPTFNANDPLKSTESVRRNRVVTDSFEPGSTFKTFTVAGALSQGLVRPNTKIDCGEGELRIGQLVIREAHSRRKFGSLTVSGVLSYSSNIGSAKIALKLGDERLRETLKSFGFGKRLGFDLPGESRGILHTTPWRDHLLSNISFGHGITATPLQVAAAYAAIANGGLLKKPYMVQSIVSSETGMGGTGVREDFGPEVIRRVLKPSEAATMKLILAGVTLPGGTGASARVHGFPVAGKTGTAQKVRVGRRGYSPGKYISSFVGFIPVHQPKYVIYIAVDSPEKEFLWLDRGGTCVFKSGQLCRLKSGIGSRTAEPRGCDFRGKGLFAASPSQPGTHRAESQEFTRGEGAPSHRTPPQGGLSPGGRGGYPSECEGFGSRGSDVSRTRSVLAEG